jgi:hypothetical protein
MRTFLLLTGLVACGDKGADTLVADPTDIAWGDIDFQADMPDVGYQETEVVLRNDAEEQVLVDIVDFDFDHLCSPGLPSAPFEVGTLSPGQSLSFFVSVCDYSREDGERDAEVGGTLTFETDLGGRADVTWSFTPVENL